MASFTLSFTYQGMEYGIAKPAPKLLLVEEFVCLAKHVHLRILIQHSCRHKLVENTDTQWR